MQKNALTIQRYLFGGETKRKRNNSNSSRINVEWGKDQLAANMHIQKD